MVKQTPRKTTASKPSAPAPEQEQKDESQTSTDTTSAGDDNGVVASGADVIGEENMPAEKVAPFEVEGTVKEEGTPEGRILEPGEELTFDGEKVGEQVVIKEDVYRKVFPRGTRRPSYILVYRAGTMIPAVQAEQKQAKKEDDTDEE